ncbi:MAG: hypothetical protein EBS06_05510 [Proteobacteria bacterium]|nr:hypothetical protein [Pseudomonadota bacterium]
MILENLKKQLIIDENCKLEIYLDDKGLPTVGIGHLLTKKDPEFMQWQVGIKANPKFVLKITQKRCDELFAKDIESVIHDCKFIWPDFDSFLEEVQEIIANMVFNLGQPKLSKLFPSFIQAIKDRNYKRAALEMKYNNGLKPEQGLCDWYVQTKDRAKRLVNRMETLANKQNA